jgi:hypothetical protein
MHLNQNRSSAYGENAWADEFFFTFPRFSSPFRYDTPISIKGGRAAAAYVAEFTISVIGGFEGGKE